MFNLGDFYVATKFYPYRTAFARNVIIKIPRTHDTIDSIETEFAKRTGGRVDNHTTYMIQNFRNKEQVFYITCSGSTYYIGLSVDEGRR